MKTDGFDKAGSAGKRLRHNYAKNLHDNGVWQFQQAQEQPAWTIPRFMAQSDARLVGVKTQHAKHCAAALVEAGFGNAGFDALGNRFVSAALILNPHAPQRRTANCVSDHDAQRHAGIGGKRRPHRRMAVQVDIAGHGCGDFGAAGLGRCIGRFAFGDAFCFALCQIAFVKRHFAIVSNGNIDPPAFALGGGGKLVAMEVLPIGQNDNIAPSVPDIRSLAFLDGRALRVLELAHVPEIAVLLEQVFDDTALIGFKVEQRDAG